jgi:branched-chain amino acid transport system permease protein
VNLEFVIGQAVTNGLIVGLLYLLMAIGFTLVFGVMRIANFAHGEFYMLGAYGAFVCVTRYGMPYLGAVFLTFFMALLLGWIIEVLVLKSFRNDELNGMIATLGVAVILQNGALILFGPDPQSMPAPVEGILRLGPIVMPMSRLYVVGFSVAVLIVLYLFLMHTRTGRALRAVVQDTEIASAQGIHTRIIYPLGFALGVGLAAIAGALIAPVFSVSPFIGTAPLYKAFIVVVLGGLGSIPGAALASLLLGVAESIGSTFFNSDSADIVIFSLVMLVLVIRPTGLLGVTER